MPGTFLGKRCQAPSRCVVVFALGRSLWVDQTAGVDELIGLVGRTTTVLAPDGKVFVRGEYWNCVADGAIDVGDAVEVVGIQGLTLRVRRATEGR